MQDKYTLPEVRWQPQKAILLWAFVLSALLLNATLNAQANTFDTRKLPPGIVTNTNTGATFSSIQAAIDAAATLDGHTITVASGTYTENVTVSKSLTITGANVGTAGTATRTAESVLQDGTFNVTAANAVIDGFHIYQTNNTPVVMNLSSASNATVQNSIFERVGVTPGANVRAIEISSGNTTKTINNNLFTGSIAGGVFGSHLTWQGAIYVNGTPGTVSITGNTFDNVRSALNLDDFSNTNTVSGNTFKNNGTHMSFGGNTPTTGAFTLGANEFKTPQSGIINLSNVTTAFRLDITSSTFNGAAFSLYTVPQLLLIESAMYHRGRSGRNGLVTYITSHQYVNAGQTTIQSAVDYSSANNVIHVNSGTFNEIITVNKNLTFEGANKDLCGTSTRTAETVLVAPATETGVIKLNGPVTATFNGFLVDGLGIAYLTDANQSLTLKNSVFELDFLPGKNNLYAASTALTLECNYFKAIGGTNDGSSSHIFAGGGTFSATGNTFTHKDAYGSLTGSTTSLPIWMNLTGNSTFTVKNNFFTKFDNGILLAATASGTIETNEFSEAKRAFYTGGTGYGAGIAIFSQYAPSAATLVQKNKFYDSELGVRTSTGDPSNSFSTNLSFSNNSFVNMSIGAIRVGNSYNASATALNATCNWFSNAPVLTGNPANINYVPKLTSGTDESGDIGFQQSNPNCVFPINNITHPKGFATIQAAIDDPITQPNDVIRIDAGTYNENFTVTKTLTFEGANRNVCGTTTRSPETILVAPATATPALITLSGSVTATFNGVLIDGMGVSYLTQPNQGLVFKNSVLELDFVPGQNNIYTASSSLTLDCNYFKAIGGTNNGASSHVFVSGGAFTAINNTFTSATAISSLTGTTTSLPVWLNITTNTSSFSVANNLFTKIDIGILLADNAGNGTIQDNEFNEPKRAAYTMGTSYGTGIALFGSYNPVGPVVIQRNKFYNGETGIRTSTGDPSNNFPTPSLLTISNNSFENLPNGAFRIGNTYNGSANKLNATCNWFSNNAPVVTGASNINYIPQLASGVDDNSGALGFQQNTPVCVAPTALYVNDNSMSGDGYTSSVGNDANPGTPALPFRTINQAISVAGPGATIYVDAGTYNENVDVNKTLTIEGWSTASVIITPTSASTGVGIAINAADVVVKKVTVDKYQYGININASGTAHKLLDLKTTNNALHGISVPYGAGPEAASITGLEINNVQSTGNGEAGLLVFATVAGSKVFDNVVIKNSDFSNNAKKGIYLERANNLTIDNVTVDNSGTDATNGNNNNGIDINLKYANYSGLTIKNSFITNSGEMGTGGNPANPSAIAIKARRDGGYSGNPATLTTVLIENNTISGPQNGIRVGEPGQTNDGTSGVMIQKNNLSAAFANKQFINRTNNDATLICNYHGSTDYDDVVAKLQTAGTRKNLLNSVATNNTYASCVSPTGITLAVASSTVCVGSTIDVTASGLLASTATTVSYKLNNGTTQTYTGTTNASGELTFSISASAGSYTISISEVESNSTVATINPPASVTAAVLQNAVAGTVSGASPIFIDATTTYTNTGGTAGGTWSSSDPTVATVDNSGVVTGVASGTANIIYTITGCGGLVSSQATVQVQPNPNTPNVADVTTVVYVAPSLLYGVSSFSVVVEVYELNGTTTSGPITVLIPKQTQTVALSLPQDATSIMNRSVQNAAWTLDNSDGDFYKITTNTPVTGGNILSFGLQGILTPGSTSGQFSIISVLAPGSGGETNITNNSSAVRVEYFAQ